MTELQCKTILFWGDKAELERNSDWHKFNIPMGFQSYVALEFLLGRILIFFKLACSCFTPPISPYHRACTLFM